ncbi:coiled-coil domain-containing protein 125 [Hyla sarda]|uniref:coiled-coil domain-containing protein 125 n=1 Tax=Hyla sarda TaxID=327740 RepID=UPI0024C3FD21|nr:coiled-coil domain-containing protein 125 [Hyla sarda]XP_056395252.1 coiled-coil domain-containing protein 125 [Hyla sarda]
MLEMTDHSVGEPDCLSEEEEDFMAGGDLGEGFGRKPGGLYEGPDETMKKAFRVRKGSRSLQYHLLKKGEDDSNTRHHSGKNCLSEERETVRPAKEGYTRCRQNSIDASSEISNEDLRQRLQDLSEEVEILRVELEASQRQLDGKDEALRILQNMAVFDKATSHTKVMLQKAEDQRRAMEKEINVLQWEIEFDQVRLKNMEESWKEKYERVQCENSALKESLEQQTNEVKILKSENTIINHQCQELLAMLDVKQQKMFQDNVSLDKSSLTEVTALELAVLGACTCCPGGDPCSCAKMSAATRKQLLQLRQEFEVEKKGKEEAYVMADAFRIAFEQQLKRRNDATLPLSEIERLCKKGSKRLNNWRHLKEDECSISRDKKRSLGQKLRGMMISASDGMTLDAVDDPQEIFRLLIDLLNDKEEALAHQRKVSYMLARTIEGKLDPATCGNSNPKEESPARGNEHNCSDVGTTEDACLCPTDKAPEGRSSQEQIVARTLETSFSLLLKDVYPQQEDKGETAINHETLLDISEHPQT